MFAEITENKDDYAKCYENFGKNLKLGCRAGPCACPQQGRQGHWVRKCGAADNPPPSLPAGCARGQRQPQQAGRPAALPQHQVG